MIERIKTIHALTDNATRDEVVAKVNEIAKKVALLIERANREVQHDD